ncbi:helix-turn-helix domain-containing protein [Campylobacter sputorum]|uniref:helix-turn-helix domain-containing protein n=1 Tax=Campylobacter sputorum TaxID=206 RepID=UPI000691D405|nr:AraC family transcriptional regulator [Campylobacter sputorum]
MSKIIDNGEIRKHSTIKNGKLYYKDSDFIYDINFFTLQNGISYMESKILLNTDISFNETFDTNYHFLYFNSSNTNALCCQKNKKLILKPDEILTISILKNFRYKVIYDNRFYNFQAIMLDDNFIKEFDVFKDKNQVLDNLYVKQSIAKQSQKFILNELKNADIYSGKLKELFIESKVLELLFLTFSNLKISDSKTIQKAKDILLKDLTNPPSIKKLAKMCATNEFSLQDGFKKCFNKTIYGYLKDERLKLTFELLKRDDINVSEAAKMVGYNNLSHFTKIFKEKFGVLPSKI